MSSLESPLRTIPVQSMAARSVDRWLAGVNSLRPQTWTFGIAILLLLTLTGCSQPKDTTAPPVSADQQTSPPAPPAASETNTPTTPAEQPAATGVKPIFEDIAEEAGIDFVYDRDVVEGRWMIVEVMGGGVAWLDADLDGWLDLFFTNGGQLEPGQGPAREAPDQLYRNLGPSADGQIRFRNATQQAGMPDGGYGQGVAVGDYDADGFPDIYVTNYGKNLLLHNNGDGTFTDQTDVAGVGDTAWGTAAFFADLNADGQLDLYVANFIDQTPENVRPCDYGGDVGYCGPGTYRGLQDAVFVSQGDGTFVEKAKALGFIEPDGAGKGLAAVAVDFDHDLRPEIYVGNDMTPNLLYTPVESVGTDANQPTPDQQERLYREIAVTAGCALSDQGENEATMGIACDDLNDDGLPDLFLAHFHKAKNTLYRNLGSLQFADESRRTKIAATSFDNLGFGAVALDWDRNGFLDLFVTTGHVLGPNAPPEKMPPQLLRRTDRTRFEDVSGDVAGTYFQGRWLGRGVAGGDFDNDGDLDIAVAHNASPSALLENRTEAGGSFLGLELATPSRIPPIGGRVEVVSGNLRMVRPIFAGGSYQASHDPRLLFTLSSAEEPAQVTIHWPSGRVDQISLTGDRYWRVVEGSLPVPSPQPRSPAVVLPSSTLPDATLLQNEQP